MHYELTNLILFKGRLHLNFFLEFSITNLTPIWPKLWKIYSFYGLVLK